MKIKKFSELSRQQLNYIVNIHYNHWVKFNPKMDKEETTHDFLDVYSKDKIPFGIALVDDLENIVGFCVLKTEHLKKYPDIFPWITSLMIIDGYRGKGYGRIIMQNAERILKEQGYKEAYLWTDQVPEFHKKMGFQYVQEVERNEGGYGQLFHKKI